MTFLNPVLPLFLCCVAAMVATAQTCTPPATLSFKTDEVVQRSAPVRWTPENPAPGCKAVALQLYFEGGFAERRNVASGQVTIGDLAGDRFGRVELKLWLGASTPASSVFVNIDSPCTTARLDLEDNDSVTRETLLEWTPRSCRAAALQLYRNDQLICNKPQVSSGDVNVGDCAQEPGPIVVSLFMGGAKPSSLVRVVVLPVKQPSITRDFENLQDEEADRVTEEIGPTVPCGVEGPGKAERTAEFAAAHGSRGVSVFSNFLGWRDICNHVIWHQVFARYPIYGWQRAGCWAKIDPETAAMIQAGPECATGITRWSKVNTRWETTEAGIQYQRGCNFTVWTTDTNGNPYWRTFATRCLKPGVFYKLTWEFNVDGNYGRFLLNDNQAFDLSHFKVPTLPNKFKEFAVVASMESEALRSGLTEAFKYNVVYDLLSLQPLEPDLVPPFPSVSAAKPIPGDPVTPGMILSGFGSNLTNAIRVNTTDGADVIRPATVYYVGPNQINYKLPDDIREGRLQIEVLGGGGDKLAATEAAVGPPSSDTLRY
jgi:hypothetical protein